MLITTTSSPLAICRTIILICSLILNLTAFRSHPCSCTKKRCLILPLFLIGNLLTLLLHIPDLVLAFGGYFPIAQLKCSFVFVSSSLLCGYFVALGILRCVLILPDLRSYRPYFYASLIFTPLIAAGIQVFYMKAALEEPLFLHFRMIPNDSDSAAYARELVLPVSGCARTICNSSDVILTMLGNLVPALIPTVSFIVSFLVSYSSRRRVQSEKYVESDIVSSYTLAQDYCDRENHCWQVLKFVLILFFGWTVFAKPLTLFLTYLTRYYASSRIEHSSVYFCSNFWDIGNNVILFIAVSVVPFCLILSHRSTCNRTSTTDKYHSGRRSKSLQCVDRPVAIIGSPTAEADVGMFTWDTFCVSTPVVKLNQCNNHSSVT
ncbi:uncharacterized protein LOC129584780 [Paramacrobiotus metropolitanus]|uniref:uncharacterized protein LOC129584780 n=1 Tax=Paramacrobiotus metropolitanus TaxID=2943436 RepID=UPI002445C7DC|nr:uncharacterized protein LOC129584780 [Paramacrobiotus metropolitanus]